MKILIRVSYNSLWGDLVEILVKSSQVLAVDDLVPVFVRRSSGDPCEMLSEALARSCTGPCEKLL